MRVILKDKKDLNTLRSKGWSKDGYKIIGSQDEINRDLEVEVVSVKFSKIGQKTFDAYPNLKWIICRCMVMIMTCRKIQCGHCMH